MTIIQNIVHRLTRLERSDPEDLEFLVSVLFRLCLIVFWLGASAIVLYAIFENGVPPEPEWWVAFEATIGITW
jgi:hypothetical protein